MYELWKRSRGLLSWLREHNRGWLNIILTAIRHTFTSESSFAAAAISYFALFSFFPLILFTSVVAGTWLAPWIDKNQIISQLDFVAPALGYLLERHLQRIVGLEQTITGLSLVSLIWSSSSIFYVLTRTLDRVWKVSKRRPVWQHRGMAVLSVLLISAILLLASIAYSTVVSVLQVFTPSQLRQFSSFASEVATVTVGILLFAIVYRFLPHFPIQWRDILPGAIGAGLLWEIVKRIFFLYATQYLAQPNLTELIYGSVATIIAFMGWSYASSMIFIFGAHLNVGYCEWRKQLAAAQAAAPTAATETLGERPAGERPKSLPVEERLEHDRR